MIYYTCHSYEYIHNSFKGINLLLAATCLCSFPLSPYLFHWNHLAFLNLFIFSTYLVLLYI